MLITNFGEQENHSTHLAAYAADAVEITILSPFLSPDMFQVLGGFSLDRLERLRLVTTLEPGSRTQIPNVQGMASLRRFLSTRSTARLSLGIADGLHGKVYLFSDRVGPYAAVVTSANFTMNGLKRNFEWGVRIADRASLEEISASIRQLPVRELGFPTLDRLIAQVAAYAQDRPDHDGAIPLNLDVWIPHGAARRTAVSVWLKPSGVADDPVLAGDPRYAEPEVQLNFTTRRPSGLSIGDLVVVYGVGARKLLGLFRVLTPPIHASEEEMQRVEWKRRWPWHVRGENLAPYYSANWWHHDLQIRGLETEYLSTHPTHPLTMAGGQSLGALNYGADKIRLAPGFGEFLVGKVNEAELTPRNPGL